VGEVRDEDTATMAFRAAMTGHQVYSTLHTNSAIGAIPRLADIGILPEILSGNIIGIIANLQKANQSLRVDGKVIWTRKTRNGAHFHMGVEFLHKFPDTVLLLIKQLHGLNPPT